MREKRIRRTKEAYVVTDIIVTALVYGGFGLFTIVVIFLLLWLFPRPFWIKEEKKPEYIYDKPN